MNILSIHPLSEEKVAINKALLARVIEQLNDKYLVYELEEVLNSEELDETAQDYP
jgi:hypothetical protein